MTGTTALQVAELIPSGFNVPEYFALSGAIAIAGIGLDLRKQHLDNNLEQQFDEDEARLGVADPFTAENSGMNNRRTKWAERGAYYGAVAVAALAVAQFGTKPFNSHSRANASATLVIEADNAENIPDMQGGLTRLQASIEGGLAAAGESKVPFTFIFAGTSPQRVATVPAQNKNLTQTKREINAVVTPSFENGDSLANNATNPGGNSLTNALGGPQPNDIIIIGSAVDSQDVTGVQTAESQVKSGTYKDTLSAVVVGSSNTNYQIGFDTVPAAVNAQSFRNILGSNRVTTATSTAGVENAITNTLDHAEASDNNQPNDTFEDAAALVAAFALALGVARRLSGIVKQSKRRK